MSEPHADPTGLAAKYIDELPAETVVVNIPSLADARLLSDATPHALRYVCHDFAVARALQRAGFDAAHAVTFEAAPACLVYLPKGKERVAMTFELVASTLGAGTPLWVVGPKRGGIKSAVSLLGRVADVGGVDSGRRCKLARATTTLEAVRTLADYETSWQTKLRGRDASIHSYPGVFGHGRLDDGTRLLLDTLEPTALGERVADVGCGAGVIGLWASMTGAEVFLGDADILAVKASRRTLEANGATGEVFATDGLLELPGLYDGILSNPPFHKGFATDYSIGERLVMNAPSRLRSDGVLTVVINQFLKLPDAINAAFGGYETLANDRRYRVIQARK